MTADPVVDRAGALADSGRQADALRVLASYLASHPDDPAAWCVAARAQYGLGEHALRYERLAQAFVAAGYTVWADEHRGHGQTGLGQTGGDRSKLGRLGPGGHRAAVASVRAIGRLLAALSGDVAVVFTSVHGDMHGAHGLFRKGWPHEESVRVPLLTRNRRAETGGRKSEEPVSLIDLPAMTLAWAEGREWRCGRDHATISMPAVVALPHQCDRVWSGVRSAAWKRIFNADGSPWLEFDLENDPMESTNKAGGNS